jgi:hypothetical protein
MHISVVEGLDGKYLAPGCEPVHIHAITLRKVMHVQEENFSVGQPE